jgi:hypothetical protein
VSKVRNRRFYTCLQVRSAVAGYLKLMGCSKLGDLQPCGVTRTARYVILEAVNGPGTEHVGEVPRSKIRIHPAAVSA